MITTFKKSSGGCCCLRAPIARPATAGHAILPDRFMRALCEPTRCRPSTAPSQLINQRHPAKTWEGGRTQPGQESWAGLHRGPLTPPGAAPEAPTLPTPVPGCSGIRRAARGLPSPRGPGTASHTGMPLALSAKRGQSHPLALRHCAALIPSFHTLAMPELQPSPLPQTKPILMR